MCDNYFFFPLSPQTYEYCGMPHILILHWFTLGAAPAQNFYLPWFPVTLMWTCKHSRPCTACALHHLPFGLNMAKYCSLNPLYVNTQFPWFCLNPSTFLKSISINSIPSGTSECLYHFGKVLSSIPSQLVKLVLMYNSKFYYSSLKIWEQPGILTNFSSPQHLLQHLCLIHVWWWWWLCMMVIRLGGVYLEY